MSSVKKYFSCLNSKKGISIVEQTHWVIPKRNVPVVSNFGSHSQILQCPYCGCCVTTEVQSKTTLKTHLCAMLMCLSCLGLCFGCPYSRGSCKDTNHYCPQCKECLGTHRNSLTMG